MSASNSRNLEKVTTSDFSTGGLLSPEQFSDFFEDVQEQGNVLSRARAIPVSADSGDIPRIGVGSRLLQSASEGGSGTKQTVDQPSVSYQTTKVTLPWELTWESVNETIDDAEATIRQVFANQFAADLEILASVGDEASGDAFEAINDGWFTIAQARGAANHDHMDGGTTAQPVNNELFESMIDLMGEKYIEGGSPVFLLSHAQKNEYKQFLTDRSTGAGDAMLLTGEEPTPYGYNILTPLGWPDDVAMFTSMQNLVYVLQDDLRVKQTSEGESVVMNDLEAIYNLLAKIDYQILDEAGVVTATNIAAP